MLLNKVCAILDEKFPVQPKAAENCKDAVSKADAEAFAEETQRSFERICAEIAAIKQRLAAAGIPE